MNQKRFIKIMVIIVLIVLAGFTGYFIANKQTSFQEPTKEITTFEECAKAGNPIMEFYPRQCRNGNKTFTENIGNELEKVDLIRLDNPRPNQVIQSPLTITGEARGFWFFEASFPIVLTNWDGLIIAQGIATTKSNWMTSDFVPFEATLTFIVDKNTYSNKGLLILRKDNPSGLPENDNSLEIPVVFSDKVIGTTPQPPKACTQEAKLCPDGSYVGRTGPNCEFTPCPSINPESVTECTKDSHCPSSKYTCQEIQGTGTACPSTDPSCVPTYTIIKGECKLKEGNQCLTDSDCVSGLVCNKNICTNPIGSQCSGPNDISCPSDYECIQGCGSPVGYPGEPSPPYFCQLKGYIRTCPICLSVNTLIDTPLGAVPIQQLQKGMSVWTINKSGKRIAEVVIKTSEVPVTTNHRMVQLILNDERNLLVSPGHPTADGRTVGDLISEDLYDGASVVSSKQVEYGYIVTYDILPSGETGFYWANGILLDSTLH